jgi:homoaconitase/3-isopropylmalate dehydratase large subunit
MKSAWKRWIFKRRVRSAIRLLARIDHSMSAAGFNRAERRQVWRDFIKTKDGLQRVVDFMAEGIL